MTRRVVVTGMGIISSLGGSLEEVTASLYQGRSGLVYMPEMKKMGMKCSVFGPVRGFDAKFLTNKAKLTMSQVAQYAMWATHEAIRSARLADKDVQNDRCGIAVGGSFGGINEVFKTERFVKRKHPSRAGSTGVVRVMNSTTSGNIAAYFKVKGSTTSLCSSFAAGLDNIGQGYELIKFGLQDLVICGASEEEAWKQVGPYFENAGAMVRGWNDRPEEACRPYDRCRRGFVMSAGSGILILESLEHAKKRSAPIIAEIVGYGSANDGNNLFSPSGEGLKRAMRRALRCTEEHRGDKIDYINGHGTGTPITDRVEVQAIRDFFGEKAPWLSSTKGLAGHGMGATGAQEAVYTLLMLRQGFIAPTRNLVEIDEECRGVHHVQTLLEEQLNLVMTVSLGLGGTASCLVFKRF